VVREVLLRTLEQPGAVAEWLGRSEDGLEILFNSSVLTVLNVVWAPRMSIYPHDHRMWAVIGIYGGAEGNTLFRRSPQGLAACPQVPRLAPPEDLRHLTPRRCVLASSDDCGRRGQTGPGRRSG
jgi:predicted metal-dependent enzyme (double-stranded beta helix superfamily)